MKAERVASLRGCAGGLGEHEQRFVVSGRRDFEHVQRRIDRRVEERDDHRPSGVGELLDGCPGLFVHELGDEHWKENVGALAHGAILNADPHALGRSSRRLCARQRNGALATISHMERMFVPRKKFPCVSL